MCAIFPLNVPLGKPEVYEEDFARSLVEANDEVGRLDVSVNVPAGVEALDSGEHLVHDHEHSLERKPFEGAIEERLETRPHEVHH